MLGQGLGLGRRRFLRRGVTPYNANMLLSFEGGANGDPIDAPYLEANDIGALPNIGGPSSWLIIGTTPTVSTAQARNLITPVRIAGTDYAGTGTKSAKFTTLSEGEFLFAFQDDPATQDVTVAFWWKSTLPEPDPLNGTYDYCTLGGRHDGVNAAWGTFQVGAGWNARAHAGGGTGTGENIPIHTNTWYWVVSQYKRGDGHYLRMYGEDRSLVGTSYCQQSANVQGVRFVEFGNIEAHASFQAGDVYFDNIVIIWGDTTPMPIGP